jgi:hypothetical protein
MAHHYRAVLAWGPQAYQPDSISSPRDWYAGNLGKIDFSVKFVIPFHLRKELPWRKGLFGRFYLGKEAPKTILA